MTGQYQDERVTRVISMNPGETIALFVTNGMFWGRMNSFDLFSLSATERIIVAEGAGYMEVAHVYNKWQVEVIHVEVCRILMIYVCRNYIVFIESKQHEFLPASIAPQNGSGDEGYRWRSGRVSKWTE